MSEDYKKGYKDAIDDMESAMKKAERHTLGPLGLIGFNDPNIYVYELKRLYKLRFPDNNLSTVTEK